MNWILTKEERQTKLEAHTNVHIQSYAKTIQWIDFDLTELNNCGDRHRNKFGVIGRKLSRQEDFNCWVEQRMEEMEAMMEAQGERIIALEEEVAILKTRKACKCGEANVTSSSSGSREDPIKLEEEELEYAEEEGSGSNQSYHTPPRAEEQLLVFRSPVSQTLPTDISETCGCPDRKSVV